MKLHDRYRVRFTEAQLAMLEGAQADDLLYIVVDVLNDAADHIADLVAQKADLTGLLAELRQRDTPVVHVWHLLGKTPDRVSYQCVNCGYNRVYVRREGLSWQPDPFVSLAPCPATHADRSGLEAEAEIVALRSLLARLVADRNIIFESTSDDYFCRYCRNGFHESDCPVREAEERLAAS